MCRLPTVKTYLLFIALFYTFSLGAQNTTVEVKKTPKRHKHDTNYVHKFDKDILSIAPLISAPNFELRFQPEIDSLKHKHNRYQPYLRDVIGFTTTYRAVTLSLRVKGRISPEEQERFGSTDYSIIRLRLNTNPFLFDFYHNTFSGFSDRNAREYDSTRTKANPFIKRRDINMQYTKLRVLYIHSYKKYSYRAANRFIERQKKSRASAFISSHLYRINTWGDSSFFNRGQERLFGRYGELKSLKVYSFGLGPGIAGTLVHKKWFFSFNVQVLGDVQYHTAFDNKNVLLSEGTRGAIMGDASFSFGYNGDRFYAGFIAKGDRSVISLPNVDASTLFFNAEINIGIRFTAPKIFGKVYDNTPLKYL